MRNSVLCKGVLDLVTRIMKCNVESTSIQSAGCKVLDLIASFKKYHDTLLVEYGTYEILIQAMENHKYHMDVQESAFLTLEVFAQESAEILINKGIIDVVSQARKRFEANNVMQKILDNIMNQIS
eukprot:gb/GECH01001655.1/.p1 GENE.gb/GECH01001655.1/~~gb/GECH01001655.1/.p1  ORF type:complete len:125 (+),score=21.92 gb/GECH01001655.1/:1-375(+)